MNVYVDETDSIMINVLNELHVFDKFAFVNVKIFGFVLNQECQIELNIFVSCPNNVVRLTKEIQHLRRHHHRITTLNAQDQNNETIHNIQTYSDNIFQLCINQCTFFNGFFYQRMRLSH